MIPAIDPATRPEPPETAAPVAMVNAFLDFQRATLLWKISGLPEIDLRRSMVASGTNLLAIVKHSACVEQYWFQRIFAGHDIPVPWRADDPNADWRIEPGETVESIVDRYERATEISREVVAGRAWGDLAARQTTRGERFSLGWIMSHMLEEIARHVGQADILREQIDGATGE